MDMCNHRRHCRPSGQPTARSRCDGSSVRLVAVSSGAALPYCFTKFRSVVRPIGTAVSVPADAATTCRGNQQCISEAARGWDIHGHKYRP